jgi:Sulfatase
VPGTEPHESGRAPAEPTDQPRQDGAAGAARAPRGPHSDLPGDEIAPGAPEVDGDGPGPGRRPWWRVELLAALEIAGLAGLAFTRPVLDSFGRSPETFLARDASRNDVVLFALVVAIVPTAVVALAAAASRLAGWRVRRVVHLALIGALGGAAAWRFLRDTVEWGRWRVALVGLVAAALVVVLRHRVRSAGTYLRFLGAASVFFLVQFLVMSPSSSLALGDDEGDVDPAAADAVRAATGDEPPPIVMVVLDAVPTGSLLDGHGAIDGDLYPNLQAFADGATWYRNNSSVSAWTYEAVPALLAGRFPEGRMDLPDVGNFPHNLFTLFAGTHHVEAVEQITRLCPSSECEPPSGSALPTLLGDAADWWRGGLDVDVGGDDGAGAEGADGAEILPGALDPERGDQFVDWVDAQDFAPSGGRPGLWFYHLVLPHEPWVLLDDGSRYEGAMDAPYGVFFGAWGSTGADVGRQRQVLQTQAADRMLGHLFDRLRDAGIYDDALVVVAGDHGQAFAPGHRLRGISEEQYEQVLWTPLLVKAPGQTEGVVDDANVWTIDLLPTIAEALGITLPWDVDGLPRGAGRDPDDKWAVPNDLHTMQADEGADHISVDPRVGLERVLASDPVPATGRWSVWRRGHHDELLGHDVADLEVRGGEAGTMSVERLERMERPGDGPPVLEVVGQTDVPLGGDVAVAVNGVVSAVAPVQSPGFGVAVVHALLLPDSFGPDNEITAYTVDGRSGAETLQPLTVTGT